MKDLRNTTPKGMTKNVKKRGITLTNLGENAKKYYVFQRQPNPNILRIVALFLAKRAKKVSASTQALDRSYNFLVVLFSGSFPAQQSMPGVTLINASCPSFMAALFRHWR